MRPVVKWQQSDPTIVPPLRAVYDPYTEAKEDLERNIDAYCSYCERPAQDEAVHVEHIQPKGLPAYAHLEHSWSNFLLSCSRCNGTDNKGNKDVVFGNIHLPHLNNTFQSIEYLEGGLVKINESLAGAALKNAESLINLVGLDKRPGHSSYLPKDKRWDRRRTVWEIATNNLNKYNSARLGVDTIIDLAKGYGFWSVWFTVFTNCPDVKSALITHFRGTAGNCFDATNNHQPIPRNPGNPIDTI